MSGPSAGIGKNLQTPPRGLPSLLLLPTNGFLRRYQFPSLSKSLRYTHSVSTGRSSIHIFSHLSIYLSLLSNRDCKIILGICTEDPSSILLSDLSHPCFPPLLALPAGQEHNDIAGGSPPCDTLKSSCLCSLRTKSQEMHTR